MASTVPGLCDSVIELERTLPAHVHQNFPSDRIRLVRKERKDESGEPHQIPDLRISLRILVHGLPVTRPAGRRDRYVLRETGTGASTSPGARESGKAGDADQTMRERIAETRAALDQLDTDCDVLHPTT